jgi:hypothetical protein
MGPMGPTGLSFPLFSLSRFHVRNSLSLAKSGTKFIHRQSRRFDESRCGDSDMSLERQSQGTKC